MVDNIGASVISRILEEDDTHSQFKVYELLHRLVQKTPRNSKLAYQICAGFENNFVEEMKIAGIQFPAPSKSSAPKGKKSDNKIYGGIPSGARVNAKDWENIQQYVAAQISDEPPIETVFSENVVKLGAKLNLSEVEIDILKYIHALQQVDPSFRNFFGDLLKNEAGRFPAFIALAMDALDKFKEISKILNPSGKLASYGILDFDDVDDFAGLPCIDTHIRDILLEGEFDVDLIVKEVVGTPAFGALSVESNFRHLENQAKKIAKALRAANAKGIKGVNIVLYGPPGSGKTELAKAICQMAGLDAYAIGEDGESNTTYGEQGSRTDSSKRLMRLRQAQTFLKDSGKSVCIMDEAEDLLIKGEDTSKKSDTGSKILLNRTLEENDVPTIWLANDMDKFHASMRQRFSFPLFVGYQPTLIRKDIWQYHIEKNGLQLQKTDYLRLARLFDAPPRVIAQACQAAAMLDGSFANITEQVRDKASLDFSGYRAGYDAAYPVHEEYDISYLESDADLGGLVSDFNAASKNDQCFSLLIKGDKDVGKSTLAYYLAEQSMLHVMSVDMEEMVIPTNQAQPVDNISSAFAQASIRGAVLVIENMDELFANTTDALDRQKMVARFMDEMQTHKLPVIMTERSQSQLPDEFRAFVDTQVKLDKIPAEKLVAVYRQFVGRENLSSLVPLAIGSVIRAARSAVGTPLNQRPEIIERRIAAQALISQGLRPTGFRQP